MSSRIANVVFASCVILMLSLTAQAENRCNSSLENTPEEPKGDPQKVVTFFEQANQVLLEREHVLDSVFLAMATSEHVLMLGPPGNAKSLIARSLLPKILDEKGEPSFWKHQVTPETNLSDTHGPLSFKALEQDQNRRIFSEGMLKYKTAFLDEIFDGNPKTQRNILETVNERTFSQGSHTEKGDLEIALAASNKYLAQVFEAAARVNYEEGPRALLDRFAFKVYVPEEFLNYQSDLALFSGGEVSPNINPISFADVDAVREMVDQVTIPKNISIFTTVFANRLHLQLKTLEATSVSAYKTKMSEGEIEASLPYRQTSYISKRTLAKTNKVLRAIVIWDYLKNGQKRDLIANIEDVRKLSQFFTLKGPGTVADVSELYGRAVTPYEKAELKKVVEEDRIFNEIYDELVAEYNEELVKISFNEMSESVDKAVDSNDTDLKFETGKQLIQQYISQLDNLTNFSGMRPWSIDGSHVAREFYSEYLKTKIDELLGQGAFERELAPAIKAAKQAVIEKSRIERKEKARLAEEERRKQELEKRLEAEIADHLEYFNESNITLTKVSVQVDRPPLFIISDSHIHFLSHNLELGATEMTDSGVKAISPIIDLRRQLSEEDADFLESSFNDGNLQILHHNGEIVIVAENTAFKVSPSGNTKEYVFSRNGGIRNAIVADGELLLNHRFNPGVSDKVGGSIAFNKGFTGEQMYFEITNPEHADAFSSELSGTDQLTGRLKYDEASKSLLYLFTNASLVNVYRDGKVHSIDFQLNLINSHMIVTENSTAVIVGNNRETNRHHIITVDLVNLTAKDTTPEGIELDMTIEYLALGRNKNELIGATANGFVSLVVGRNEANTLSHSDISEIKNFMPAGKGRYLFFSGDYGTLTTIDFNKKTD